MNQHDASNSSRPINNAATLGGGCFWCLEAVFVQVIGVSEVVSGYSGGNVSAPSYEAVCTGNTGHAEVVQVTFDPETVAYEQILRIFFGIHDPTTLNRQGADVGTQYRSVIFYHDDGQKAAAKSVIKELNKSGIWDNPIVTELVPLESFYRAEDYHQNYFENNPNQSYCRVVVAPKIAKFRKEFSSNLRR